MTKRQREILTIMRDNSDNDDGELVYESGIGYLGFERVASRTVFALLRMAAISLDQYCKIGGCERYRINETGQGLLESERR